MAITASHESHQYSDTPEIEIRSVSSTAPNRWLAKGIQDFKKTHVNSLLYGLLFVVAGAVTIWLTKYNPFFVMAILTGFYLVGPPVAAGLYDMSHRLEHNKKPTLLHAVSVLGRNIRCLMGLTFILGLLMVAWTAVAMLIVKVFFGHSEMFSGNLQAIMAGEQSMPFAGVLLLGGIILAVLASALALTFLPLLSQRKIGTVTVLVILGAIMLSWVRLMVLAINAFVNNSETIATEWNTLFTQPEFIPFIIVFLLAGLIFAAVAFSISVVAVPLITHRNVNVFTAISTSIKTVKKNPKTMFRWAATIAVLMAVGIGFFFVGLAVALPVIGHASWHAYRELVVQE